jgi:hypothetical protein
MTDPRPDAAPDVMTIQIAGSPEEPERVLIVSRPDGGRVRVREWSAAGTSGEREMAVDEILALVTRAAGERRRVSEDLHAIRRWLGAR